MRLDLDLGPEEIAIQDSVSRFCYVKLGKEANARAAVRFSRPLWLDFAELGLLESCRHDVPGGALQVCVGVEVLGGAAFPGPVAQTVAAAALLGGEDWQKVVAGQAVVAFGTPPVLAWGAEADIVIVCTGDEAFQAAGRLPQVDTLAETRSGALESVEGSSLGPAKDALARYDMAVAAYLQGAGRTAVEAAAEHARTRRQFGKALGEFQAVAFPLAEALMKLNAARIITRFAALAIDRAGGEAPALAAAARLSATRAALAGCYAAHQTFGASGQLTEGPVAWLSRPVQELAAQNRGPMTLRAQLPLKVVSALDLDAWGI